MSSETRITEVRRYKQAGYNQIAPSDDGVMEERILNACKMYAKSDANIRLVSRTYNLTEKFFVKCIKKVYFLNALPEEDMDLLIGRILSEKILGINSLKKDFDTIQELKLQYDKLKLQKRKFDAMLKKDNNNKKNNKQKEAAIMQSISELDAKMEAIKYNKVFISF